MKSARVWSSESPVILFVADLLHPVHKFAIQRLLNGNVRQGGFRGGTMPMLFAGREPDNIAGMYFFDRTAFALHPATARGHDEGLAQRVRVPGCASAGLKCDAGAGG